MTDIVRVIQDDKHVYPETHINAVVGYDSGSGGGGGGSSVTLPDINSGEWGDMTMISGQEGKCKYFRDSDNFVHIVLQMTKVRPSYVDVAYGLPDSYKPQFPIIGTCYIDENTMQNPYMGTVDTMLVTRGGYVRFYTIYTPLPMYGWNTMFGEMLEFYTFYRSR